MSGGDINIEVARLQKQIVSLLGLRQENVIFNFRERNDVMRLDVVTINPTHEQSFLFHTVNGTDKIDALAKMAAYIENNYPEESSMTVQWMKIGDSQLHTSYFRAKNMYEALDKFYYERDRNQYKIYSIAVNPVS
ncbi:MAG: hypothetical protein U0T84_05670 [Chitinophagales bacterium]